MYYRGAGAAIVVFDVTSGESYAGAKSWVKELQRRGDPNVVIALAGNKADLKTGRVVDKDVRVVLVSVVCAFCVSSLFVDARCTSRTGGHGLRT